MTEPSDLAPKLRDAVARLLGPVAGSFRQRTRAEDEGEMGA